MTIQLGIQLQVLELKTVGGLLRSKNKKNCGKKCIEPNIPEQKQVLLNCHNTRIELSLDVPNSSSRRHKMWQIPHSGIVQTNLSWSPNFRTIDEQLRVQSVFRFETRYTSCQLSHSRGLKMCFSDP